MILKMTDCFQPEFDDVKAVRKAVFTGEQGIAVSDDLDAFDEKDETVYALVYENGKAVSCGRLIRMPYGYKIGRIATLKDYRGKGLGSALVNALCEKAESLGADKIYLEAQLHAIPFYERLGFKICSDDIIIDRNIEHKKMVRG